MRNNIVSPRFEEEFYKGQDVVHRGIRIPLHGYGGIHGLLKAFSQKARQKININVDFIFRMITESDLPVLREMWFNPKDETFPVDLKDHLGIVACDHAGDVLAGVIWMKQGNNLFLHQLVSSDKGRDAHAPYKLIWESVRVWFGGDYHSLDIGVSYNPKRYQFFQNFAVETYPIILKKPFYVPVIRLSPFRSFETIKRDRVKNLLSDNYTFFPRASYALLGVLKHLNLQPDDQVAIFKTFGSDYISACVTQQIEKVCQWRLRQITGQTKAVLIIHEFGIKCGDVPVNAFDFPVIEDCAWRSDKVFDSKYQIYSMQKLFNVNYGGLLQGVKISDEQLWEWGCFDFVKKEMFAYDDSEIGKEHRIKNWRLYNELVLADGMTPDDCYDYEHAINSGEWTPTVYLQKFEDDWIAEEVVDRLEEFGIQAGVYWGEPVVFLPIHQNMTEVEVEYIFAVVKGYYNSCRDYVKI